MDVVERMRRQGMERNRPGKGRKNRIGLSMDTLTETNLNRLAVSCGLTPTGLAYQLVKHCLEDSSVVDLFQLDYNRNPAYWVIPVTGRDTKRRLEVMGK